MPKLVMNKLIVKGKQRYVYSSRLYNGTRIRSLRETRDRIGIEGKRIEQ
jgi:hypothetical protein